MNDANILNYMPKVNDVCFFIITNLGEKSVAIEPDTVLSPDFKSRFCPILRPVFFPLHVLLLAFRLTRSFQ